MNIRKYHDRDAMIIVSAISKWPSCSSCKISVSVKFATNLPINAHAHYRVVMCLSSSCSSQWFGIFFYFAQEDTSRCASCNTCKHTN